MTTSTPDKKIIDCFWFLQNQCIKVNICLFYLLFFLKFNSIYLFQKKKGDSCEYRHSTLAHDNPNVCKLWLTSQCINANCSFRHPSGVQQVCFFFYYY